MDKVEIYYFSGSGNSFAVAKDVSYKLNAALTPIMSLMDHGNIHTEADIIGFVFPIYDFKPPEFMEDFISKIHDLKSKYIFGICTYGIAPSNSLKHLEETVNRFGGQLSLGFAVEMPQNGLGSRQLSKFQQDSLFKNWKSRVVDVSDDIKNMKTDDIETSILLLDFFKSRNIKRIPIFLKFMYYLLFKGLDALAYKSNENCTGCGTCEKI